MRTRKIDSYGRGKMSMIQSVQAILAVLLGRSYVDYLTFHPEPSECSSFGVSFGGRVKVGSEIRYIEGWFLQNIKEDGSHEIGEDTFWINIDGLMYQGNYVRARGFWWLRGDEVNIWGSDAIHRWADGVDLYMI